jgi:hypothetical protein
VMAIIKPANTMMSGAIASNISRLSTRCHRNSL